MTKKKIAAISTLLIIGTLAGITLITQPQSTGADGSPLVAQVDQQGKQLANHEARIGNTENDVKDIQNKTGTAPGTSNVTVPTAPHLSTPTPPVANPSNTSNPPATETQTPTVVAWQIIPTENGSADCRLTYSDGTARQFAWQTTNSHAGWQLDMNGERTTEIQSTDTNGICDDSAIGKNF